MDTFERFSSMSPTPTTNRLNLNPQSLQRFLDKIQIQDSGCWLWTASKPSGYGQIRITEIEPWCPILAHVLSYRLAIGDIPMGYHVHHKVEDGCIGRACVNPAHLECVNPSRHIDLTPTCPTAINRTRTVCIRGHEFTSENTRIVKNGAGRSCIACEKIREHERSDRKRTGKPPGRAPQDLCGKGHPLSGDNLYVGVGRRGTPMRGCKICRNENSKASQLRNHEKVIAYKRQYNAQLRERSQQQRESRIIELLRQVGTRDENEIMRDFKSVR